MARLESQVSKPQRTWKEGSKYVCLISKSPGYRVGQVYVCYKNNDGFLCLKGSDGFEDICSMLVSGFEVVKGVKDE